jgi:hypothetical protein
MPTRRTLVILWVITAIMVMTTVGVRIKQLVSDPVLDCNVSAAFVDAWTPTIWDAAGYCWGADRRIIVDIIIEMNPQLDPMNLQTNQLIMLPQGNSRNEANREGK